MATPPNMANEKPVGHDTITQISCHNTAHVYDEWSVHTCAVLRVKDCVPVEHALDKLHVAAQHLHTIAGIRACSESRREPLRLASNGVRG